MRTVISLIGVALLVLLSGFSVHGHRLYTLQNAYRSAIAGIETVRISENNLVQAEIKMYQAVSYLYQRLTGLAGNTLNNEELQQGATNGSFFQPLAVRRKPLLCSVTPVHLRPDAGRAVDSPVTIGVECQGV